MTLGLPFTVANTDAAMQGFVSGSTETTLRYMLPNKNATTLAFYDNTLANLTNATLSGDTVLFTALYYV